jgi:hypothetical protein
MFQYQNIGLNLSDVMIFEHSMQTSRARSSRIISNSAWHRGSFQPRHTFEQTQRQTT